MTQEDPKYRFIDRLLRLEDEYSELLMKQAQIMQQINTKLSESFTLYDQARDAGMTLRPSQVIPLIHATATLKQKIKFVMAGKAPMTASEIIEGLHKTTHKLRKQSVYVTLSRLADDGFLLRSGDGLYSLAVDNVAKAPAGASDFI